MAPLKYKFVYQPIWLICRLWTMINLVINSNRLSSIKRHLCWRRITTFSNYIHGAFLSHRATPGSPRHSLVSFPDTKTIFRELWGVAPFSELESSPYQSSGSAGSSDSWATQGFVVISPWRLLLFTRNRPTRVGGIWATYPKVTWSMYPFGDLEQDQWGLYQYRCGYISRTTIWVY